MNVKRGPTITFSKIDYRYNDLSKQNIGPTPGSAI
jgi:hypothetical protein